MPETITKTAAAVEQPTPVQEKTHAVPAPAEVSVTQNPNTNAAYSSWKLACSKGKAYAQLPDGMVPRSYAGNVASCAVACDMANRMGMDPIFVMQNLYVVQGNPSWSGKSCKALIDNSGLFAGRTRYRMEGQEGTPEWGCRLIAVDKLTGEKVEGPKVTIQMAKDAGWLDKKDGYWRKTPEMMLKYRAAAYFARSECPEVLMGASVDCESEEAPAEE